MKLTRNQKVLIKSLAKKLPEESRYTQTKVKVSHEDLSLANQEYEEDKEYTMNMPVYYEVAHEKRMSKAAKKNGIQGLVSYLMKYIKPEAIEEVMENVQLVWNSKTKYAS